jgi:hypothetical protein
VTEALEAEAPKPCECDDAYHQGKPCKNTVPERWTDDGQRRIYTSPELCTYCLYCCAQ